MATKTMILRPSYIVSCDDIIFTPSDTADEESYKLINEEIADDSLTEVSLGSGNSSIEPEYFEYGFDYSNIKNISLIKILFRVSCANAVEYFSYTFSLLNSEKSIIKTIEKNVSVIDCTGVDNYLNFYEDISSDIISELSELSEGYIQIGLRAYESSSNNKTYIFNLTQSYIELEYEEITDKYYVKHNDTWILLSDVFYKKVNGSWVSTEPSILSEKLKYLNNYIE